MATTATTIRNKKLFCLNCGGEHALRMPIPISEMTEKMKAFDKLHKNCPATWTEPKADMTKSVRERANWWLEFGEQGISSMAMWSMFCGIENNEYLHMKNHPLDPDDFSRCYKLLEAIPEWKKELSKLKTLSLQWDKLVSNWDKLTEMFESKDDKMYEFMQTLTK